MYRTEQECGRKYREYCNTVLVSSAIYDLFRDGVLGKFIGESHELRAEDDTLLTPDITTVHDHDSKGLLFEIKYSIGSSANDVLLRQREYFSAKTGWRTATGTVGNVDVVLVCNAEDTQTVHKVMKELAGQEGNDFLKSEGFALWQWIMGSAKDDREVMYLQPIAGSCRNALLEQRIRAPGGIRIPDEVLRFLRFQHAFVRDKPPVQYTSLFLLQHVLPKDPDKLGYDIPLEIVDQRANGFFPPWWESAETTKQVKRGWIKEALSTLHSLGLIQKHPGKETYTIPTSLLEKKEPLRLICRKLIQSSQRRPRGRISGGRVSRRASRGTSSLEQFFGQTH